LAEVSVTATENSTNKMTTTQTLNETSVTSATNESSSYITSSSLAETTVTTSETRTVGGILAQSLAETSVTSSDTRTYNTGTVASLSELSVSCADSYTFGYTGSAVLNETSVLSTELLLGGIITAQSVQELLSITDETYFVDMFEETVNEEVVTAADNYDISYVYGVSQSEIVYIDDVAYLVLSNPAVFLANGIGFDLNKDPYPTDLRLTTSKGTIGVPVVAVADNRASAVRIKVNGTVMALRVTK
jgi:hypothetical protein